ncbi:hypothetical protein C1646_803616, partial [Rhizophagus diaphanus]
LYLHCRVSNTSFTNVISTKEIADKIIELVEDADGYHWNFNHLYEGKNITYWYFCSQRDILASKPRKNSDPLKQRDTPSMKRFTCDGTIKISIDKNMKISEIELRHKDLHTRPVNKSVPQSVKDFIKENIDLLPREIYKRLVNNGLDISIKQKQIHFWWTELGQERYKCCEDAFESACIWLLENNYNIIRTSSCTSL